MVLRPIRVRCPPVGESLGVFPVLPCFSRPIIVTNGTAIGLPRVPARGGLRGVCLGRQSVLAVPDRLCLGYAIRPECTEIFN